MTDLNKERELYMAAKARIEKEEFFCRDWDLWKACAELKQAEINELRAELEKAKAQAVPEKKIYLTCEQLYAAANFGAPNKDPELLETELTIAWFDEAHSGSGYYVYISEYPEEGAMKLESELGAEG
ncbi:TPA: hypothetical protein ACGILD_003903 [Acinetobacter baumannii]